MIIFPPEFVKTKYKGYFWNVQTKQLYTIKGGVLKPMRAYFCHFEKSLMYKEYYYQISVNGTKKYILKRYLDKIKPEGIQLIDAVKC